MLSLCSLTHTHTNTHGPPVPPQAWSRPDLLWAVYSYFCFKPLDQRREEGVMAALKALVKVGGGVGGGGGVGWVDVSKTAITHKARRRIGGVLVGGRNGGECP